MGTTLENGVTPYAYLATCQQYLGDAGDFALWHDGKMTSEFRLKLPHFYCPFRIYDRFS